MPFRLLLLVTLASGALASTAAATPLVRCTADAPDRTLCGHVAVPLDRIGGVPGTVALRVKALPPSAGGSGGSPVVAIAGGPGQARLV